MTTHDPAVSSGDWQDYPGHRVIPLVDLKRTPVFERDASLAAPAVGEASDRDPPAAPASDPQSSDSD